jgi:hypothetical protein
MVRNGYMRDTILHTNLVIDLFVHNTGQPPLGCIAVITGVEKPSITGQTKKMCGTQSFVFQITGFPSTVLHTVQKPTPSTNTHLDFFLGRINRVRDLKTSRG